MIARMSVGITSDGLDRAGTETTYLTSFLWNKIVDCGCTVSYYHFVIAQISFNLA